MGWRDRHYSQASHTDSVARDWRTRLPPRGALLLILVHVVAWLVVAMMRVDVGRQAADMLPLHAGAHPLAIILHPIATASLWSLCFVVLAVWTIGGLIESRFGTGRTLTLYLAGNLVAGAAYFALSRWRPETAGHPLEIPCGAIAAWCLAAWRGLRVELISLFGRLVTVWKVVAVGGGIAVGYVVITEGAAAAAWLAAIALAATSAMLIEQMSIGRRPWRSRPGARRFAAPRRRRRTPRAGAGEPNIDDILAKISRAGMQALTPEERKRLEAARKYKLRVSSRSTARSPER